MGPHVASKRWSSWFAGARWHDRVWHSRLLAIAHIAIESGAIKSLWQCPWLGGSVAYFKKGEGDEGEGKGEELEEEASAAASAPKSAAKASAAAASSSARAEAGEGDQERQVKTSKGVVQELRRSCKNTMLAALTVLSTEGLQMTVRLISVLCTPLYTAHSDHAVLVRGQVEAVN